MNRVRLALIVVWVCAVQTHAVFAHSILRTAFSQELREKYGFQKGVQCWTCHDISKRGRSDGKKFRNDLGKEFAKLLADKKVTTRLGEVKGLNRNDPKRVNVNKQIKDEFLKALRALERKKAPSGETYEKSFKKGLYLEFQK